jgi:hypothetical protein
MFQAIRLERPKSREGHEQLDLKTSKVLTHIKTKMYMVRQKSKIEF